MVLGDHPAAQAGQMMTQHWSEIMGVSESVLPQ